MVPATFPPLPRICDKAYEAHLAFLTISTETDTASVLTPPMQPDSQQSAMPKVAGDIQDLEEKR